MSKSCCQKSETQHSHGCSKASSEYCTILCGEKAQKYSGKDASCLINCKNQDKCCVEGSGCEIRCKGGLGTCCEINCGCCTVVVEKCEDYNGPCCKITYSEGSEETKKECLLRCNGGDDGNNCVIKCGEKTCCVIKC